MTLLMDVVVKTVNQFRAPKGPWNSTQHTGLCSTSGLSWGWEGEGEGEGGGGFRPCLGLGMCLVFSLAYRATDEATGGRGVGKGGATWGGAEELVCLFTSLQLEGLLMKPQVA